MRKAGALIAVITLLLSPCAPAQDTRPGPAGLPPDSIHYGWADVLRVDPVYDDSAPAPAESQREECYDEQTLEPAPPPGPDNRAGATVLGAIVGGVIGHSIGKGHGRSAATAAGVVAGAAIGNSVGQQASADTPPQMTTQRRCRLVSDAPPPRRVVAYDVEYRYRGELYMSRMGYDPGDRLRVRIVVTPAE